MMASVELITPVRRFAGKTCNDELVEAVVFQTNVAELVTQKKIKQ